jgi:uncharacterized membrane protein
VSLDLALLVFPRIVGAEHAYADVLDEVGDALWMHELAFVEHHRRDRIVVRGNVAGHYVDIEDEGDAIGRRTAEGALTGALVGLLFGPPGFAVGIVGGGAVGGLAEASRVPELHGALIDELRAEVPEGSSAIVLLAAPEHVDAMVEAFEGKGGRLVRHQLSADGAKAFEAAVADRPPAASQATGGPDAA